MKVTWDKVKNLPNIEFEESDFTNANAVQQLLSGKHNCRKCGTEMESQAWRILEGYFASMRLSIEEIGKAHARSRAKKDLCSNDFSILDGFDIAVGMPKKIVLQAEKLKEITKKSEVVQNALYNDDDE